MMCRSQEVGDGYRVCRISSTLHDWTIVVFQEETRIGVQKTVMIPIDDVFIDSHMQRHVREMITFLMNGACTEESPKSAIGLAIAS